MTLVELREAPGCLISELDLMKCRHNFATSSSCNGWADVSSEHFAMSPLAGRHILIVEDEPLLAFEYSDELEAHGAHVSIVLTLGEALSALEIKSPDMAVLDVNLGRELSWPVAEALTKRGVPFLVVTGCVIKGNIPAGIAPKECLDKPVGAHIVADCLTRIASNAS